MMSAAAELAADHVAKWQIFLAGNPSLQYALRYARAGLPVFPCRPNDKRPATANGFKAATADAAEVRTLWASTPRANIAIPTGEHFWVLDVDAKSAGLESCRELETEFGELPATLYAKTPGGGFHFFLKADSRVKNTASKIAPGIDTRGHGGYVLVEGSLVQGRKYEFQDFDPLTETWPELAEAPRWLLNKIIAAQGNAPASGIQDFLKRLEGCRETSPGQWLAICPAHDDKNPSLSITSRDGAPIVHCHAGCGHKEIFEAAGWPQKTTNPGRVILTNAATITPEKIEWLWAGYLARGKIHVPAGGPGVGKTTIALSLVAAVSSGGAFPDGTRAERGRCLIWSSEDGVADTLVPRLSAAGADLKNIDFISGLVDVAGRPLPFDPARDMRLLQDAIAGKGYVLLMVDPLVAVAASDSHRNAETRRDLQPLVDLAGAEGIAVLGITHFTKGSQGRDPIERVTGSLAFGAVARVVFAVAKNEDGGRIFVRAKSNIGPDGGGFNFELEGVIMDDLEISRIKWGDPVEGAARDLLGKAEVADGAEKTATDEAVDFLRDILKLGPMQTKEIMKEAAGAGISEKTLRRARERLGIKPAKRGFSAGWWWELPAEAAE